jgi:hypothetical protein
MSVRSKKALTNYNKPRYLTHAEIEDYFDLNSKMPQKSIKLHDEVYIILLW